MEFCKISFHSVKDQKVLLNLAKQTYFFCKMLASLYSHGRNLRQISFRPLTKFGGKVQKIF